MQMRHGKTAKAKRTIGPTKTKMQKPSTQANQKNNMQNPTTQAKQNGKRPLETRNQKTKSLIQNRAKKANR